MTNRKGNKIVSSNPLSLGDITANEMVASEESRKSSSSGNSTGDSYGKFIELANKYNNVESKSRGATVWIDEDLKQTLDNFKKSGACNVPIRHMVSAAVRVFIEENLEQMKKAMKEASKGSGALL